MPNSNEFSDIDLTGSAEPSGTMEPATEEDRRPEAIPSSRASRAWTWVLPGLLVLAFVLVLVFENLGGTSLTFFGMKFRLPVAVIILASVALGALAMLALGSIRILQLRKLLKRATRRPLAHHGHDQDVGSRAPPVGD